MHLPRRALGASALALVALTTATGCTATNAQQTAIEYAPGAAAATTLGTVHVGGLFVSSDGEGPAALVARIVNSGDDAATVEIADTGASGLSSSFDVPPRATLEVGPGSEQAPTVDSLQTPPGAVLTMAVTVAGASRTLSVPVLDGTLDPYAEYVPTATPSATPSTSPTSRVTGSPSATGTRTGTPTPSATSTPATSASPGTAGEEPEPGAGDEETTDG